MTITTTMRDNTETMRREAWQNSKCVCEWRKVEIDRMHKEAPQSVPAWGTYPADRPGTARLTPNAKVT